MKDDRDFSTLNTVSRCKLSDFYETPPSLFALLNSFFNFELDICATPANAKVPAFIDEATDALAVNWRLAATRVFMNPPFSKEGRKDAFIRKARSQQIQGVTTVAILPVKTDTTVHHECIEGKRDVTVVNLKGRPKFYLNGVRTENTGRSPIMVVVFWGDAALRASINENELREALYGWRDRPAKKVKRVTGELEKFVEALKTTPLKNSRNI